MKQIRLLLVVMCVVSFASVIQAEESPQAGKKAPADAKEAKAQEPVAEQKEKAPNLVVKMVTSKGDILIELDVEKAPITVANFLKYTKSGFYNETIFHRVIKDFMIQGGGMTADMHEKKTNPPIKNESNNGLRNNRGTIAMARTNAPDSATGQFFINHKDNAFLNGSKGKPGYAVFGKVIKGMEVVNVIAAASTQQVGSHGNVPVEPVVIKSVTLMKASDLQEGEDEHKDRDKDGHDHKHDHDGDKSDHKKNDND